MGNCLDNRLEELKKRVLEKIGSSYRNPDNNSYRTYNNNLYVDSDGKFVELEIYGKNQKQSLNYFLSKLKDVYIEDIFAKGAHLDKEWISVEPYYPNLKKGEKPTKSSYKDKRTIVTLKIAPSYEMSYQNAIADNTTKVVAKNYEPYFDDETDIELTSYEQSIKERTGWSDAYIRELLNKGQLERAYNEYQSGIRTHRRFANYDRYDLQAQRKKVKEDNGRQLSLFAAPEEVSIEELEAIKKEMQDIRAKAIADGRIILKEDGTFDYALAPNGKKSNLNERQWLQVRTKAFKDWFGDWEKAYKERQRLKAFKKQAFFTFKNDEGETIRATAIKLENGDYRIIFKHEDGGSWDYIAKAEFVKQKGLDGVIAHINNEVSIEDVVRSTPEEYLGKTLDSFLKTNASKVVDENGEPLEVYHATTPSDLDNNRIVQGVNDETLGNYESPAEDEAERKWLEEQEEFQMAREQGAFDYSIDFDREEEEAEALKRLAQSQADDNGLDYLHSVFNTSTTDYSNIFKNDTISEYENFLKRESEEGQETIDTLVGTPNEKRIKKLIDIMISQKINMKKIALERRRLISKMQNQSKDVKKLREQRIRLSNIISGIDKELKVLIDERMKYDKNTAYTLIDNELKFLESMLGNTQRLLEMDDIKIDLLEWRLNNLSIYFTGKKMDGSQILTDPTEDDPIFNSFASRVNNLIGLYSQKKVEFIDSFVESDVKRRNFDKNFEEEFIKAVKEILRNPNTSIEELARVLGPDIFVFADGEQGLGVFGGILDTYYEKERQKVNIPIRQLFTQINQLFKDLKKDKKISDTSIFFKRDENGNKTNRFITPFNDNWKRCLTNVNRLLGSYQYFKSADIDPFRYTVGRKAQLSNESFSKFKSYLQENTKPASMANEVEIWEAVEYYDKVNGTNFAERLKSFGNKNTATSSLSKYPPSREKTITQEQISKLQEYFDKIRDEESDLGEEIDITKDIRNPFVFEKSFKNLPEGNISLDYVVLEPSDAKRDEYEDQDFKRNIASDKEIEKLWVLLEEMIMENINVLLLENGVSVGIDEIPLDFNIAESEVFKSYKWFQKIGVKFRAKFDKLFVEPFSSKEYTSSGKEKTGAPKAVPNATVLLKKYKDIAKGKETHGLQKFLTTKGVKYWSFNEFCQKNNITDKDLENEKMVRKIQARYKGYLAQLVANEQVLKYTSENLIASIGRYAEGISDMAARNHTIVFSNILEDILQTNSDRDSNGDVRTKEKYIQAIHFWCQRNLRGNRNIGEKAVNFWNKPRGNKKIKTQKARIENEIKKEEVNNVLPQIFRNGRDKYEILVNLKNIDDTNIAYKDQIRLIDKSTIFYQLLNDDVDKITIDGKEYKVDIIYTKNNERIKRADYLEANKIHQEDLYHEEEEIRTLGQLADGLQSLLVGRDLGLNPESGIRNRIEGEMTNIRLAAQGIFGFSEKEFYQAKRFLAGISLVKYSKLGLPYKIASKRAAQLKIYELFTQTLAIFQDHSNMGLEENENHILTAFAIDIPETHNQGEVILSTLIHMNPKIKAKDGTEEPVFDSQKNIFNIYDEEIATKQGKLQLKEKFRTPENIEKWENFSYNEEDMESINLIDNCKMNVSRSQGNYDNHDISWIQDSHIGRAFWKYKRYIPSHFYQRFKSSSVDYRKGTMNEMGMMDALAQYPNVFWTFIALDGIFSISATPAELAKLKLRPIKSIVFFIEKCLGGVFSAAILYRFLKNEQKIAEKINRNFRDKLNMEVSFLTEILTRSVGTTFNQITWGTTDKLSQKLNNKAIGISGMVDENGNPTEFRRVVSGAAQTVANLNYLTLKSFAYVYMIRLLRELLSNNCVTPEECEEKEKRLQFLDRNINFILNAYHMQIVDNTKFNNFGVLFNDMDNVSLLEYCKKVQKTGLLWFNEEKTWEDKMVGTIKINPLTMVLPNQVSKPFAQWLGRAIDYESTDVLRDLELPLQDAKVWDSFMMDQLYLTKEEANKKLYSAYQKNITALSKKYGARRERYFKSQGIQYTNKDKEHDIKAFKNRYMHINGLKKDAMIEYLNEDDYSLYLNQARDESSLD